ncbi:MAG: S8 family serine peptidase, partial [Planctomycetota bacterium]|nr:S8 family serine peptidase [Planctomycetota bacterium]
HEEVVRALQSQADWTQPAVLLELDAIAAAGEIDSYESFWISNCIRVDTIVGKVDDLAAIPGVETIYFNYPIELVGPTGIEAASDTTFNPLGAVEPGLLAINADDCWSAGYDGTGVLVANLDTGVQGDHEALESRWAGLRPEYAGNPEWAWLDYNAGSTTPWDHHWHGTHTMGTICGGSPGDSIGVAPGAHWIAGGGLDAGSIGDTVAGNLLVLEWMLDPDGDPSTVWDVPAVVGNSWGLLTGHGYPNCDDTFWAHLDALHAGGTVVIFAAGNEGSGSNTLRRPGDRAINDFTTHAVAAVDAETAGWPVAGFSSRGPTYCTSDGSAAIKPDISAPGVGIRSAWSDGGYGDSNGTSMATPHVAGVVALMIQACPDLTPTEVHTILFDTASDLGPAGKDNDYGYGMIDAWAAVQEALAQCGGDGGVDCACDAEFNVGDRVQALVDDPQGGTGIVAGQCGTVICGRDGGDSLNILIEWDDWYAGHDNTSFCECPDGESSGTTSCWWVDCPDIVVSESCVVDVDCACDDEYNAGDRVHALVDNPQGGTGIVAGQCGTVICGRDGGDSLNILIEWDDWYAGHDNTSFCECVDGDSSGTASCWWVDCPDIAAGCVPAATGACCLDGACSVVTEEECDDSGGVYMGDAVPCDPDMCSCDGDLGPCPEDITGDGLVNVLDLLAVIAAWGDSGPPRPSGDINGDCAVNVIDLLAVISAWGPCEGDGGVDCACDSEFNVGDRVQALVDNPQGGNGIVASQGGTVICGRDGGDSLNILIEWDDWYAGHDNTSFCECPDGESSGTASCWWVDCPDIVAFGGTPVDCACDAEYSAGDRVHALVDNPQGGTGIVAGQCGTVLCGRDGGDSLNILIEWDDWYTGHDNTSFCECVDGESSGTASCWWVDCPDIAAGCSGMANPIPPASGPNSLGGTPSSSGISSWGTIILPPNSTRR